MKRGHLSSYFSGVGVKSLSSTEIDPLVSRGHELQGVDAFQSFLGVPLEKRKIPAKYVWLSDDDEPLSYDGSTTWYDSRRGKVDRTPEPRFYYPAASEPIVYRARAGDTLFVLYGRDNSLTFMFCAAGSTIEKQLLWLFGLTIRGEQAVDRDLRGGDDIELGFSARYILGLIGVDASLEDDNWTEKLTARFGDRFPTTAVFSAFARQSFGDADIRADPDAALMGWLELEELLFYTFERRLISERLERGFVHDGVIDVDSFVQFSLSVQNRRKSRAGYSLENHLQFLFSQFDLRFERGAKTEGKRKPDFLFPSASAYHDAAFSTARLTLLGSKSSCKDRWRQVLSEGARVPAKHLLTLEPGISVNQTDEMRQERLQLVLPAGIHPSYQPSQREWLMSVADFIEMAAARQSAL